MILEIKGLEDETDRALGVVPTPVEIENIKEANPPCTKGSFPSFTDLKGPIRA